MTARSFNLIEAGFWFAVAIFLVLQSLRRERRFRRVLGWLSASFFVFGVSDLIEAQTGAWWRPVWLLLIKGVCLAAFVLGFRAYYKIKRSIDGLTSRSN
jgi:hypothetical protein